jgi:putative ABC transport system substrate-binding protein
MRRRDFITLFGGAVAVWPLAARAQQAALPVVGLMVSDSAVSFAGGLASVRQGLADQGYVEGRNVAIEFRYADLAFDRLPAMAADLVQRRVAVIFATGSVRPAVAAMAATKTIPIVFLEEMLWAARSVGQSVVVVRASNENEIDAAFAAIARERADALLVNVDAYLSSRKDQIIGLAARYRIPASYPNSEYVRAGGLTSYGDDRPDSQRQVGLYAARILKGDKPADLPVLQPTKFELVINVRTAKALGLTISRDFLLLADVVIE